MSAILAPQPRNAQVLAKAMDLSQAIATYDLATATGDVLILGLAPYVTTAGATFTAVTIQSNQTTAFVFMNSTQGAVANLTAQANVATTWTQAQPMQLASGQKVQYTITGAQGTGAMMANFMWLPITNGATLT